MLTRRPGDCRERGGKEESSARAWTAAATPEHEGEIRRLRVRDQRHCALATWPKSTWERLVRRKPWLMLTTLGRHPREVNISYWFIGLFAQPHGCMAASRWSATAGIARDDILDAVTQRDKSRSSGAASQPRDRL
ncbi:hypothetical protein GCM10010486_26540 [Nonomuraea roseoviolacea subsp. carminata]